MALDLVLSKTEELLPPVEENNIFSDFLVSLKKARWTKEKAQEVFKVKVVDGEVYVGDYCIPLVYMNKKNTNRNRNPLLWKILSYNLPKHISTPLCSVTSSLMGRHPKECNQLLTYVMGVSPTRLYSHISRLLYKVEVGDIRWYVNKLARGLGGRINIFKLRLIQNHKDVLDQYRDDGLYHLLPFAMWEGKSTKEMREKYGKGLWKRLCKNSFTRNKLIADTLHSSMYRDYMYKEYLSFYNKVPSTLLKGVFTLRLGGLDIAEKVVQWCIKHKCASTIVKYDFSRLWDIMYDIDRMGGRVNINWSRERLEEEHDRLMVGERRREELVMKSKSKFEKLSYIGEKFPMTVPVGDKEYEVVFLDSPYALYEEGIEMGHCIGGYYSICEKGENAMFSIRCNRKRVSSLQVITTHREDKVGSDTPVFVKGQHYGKGNSVVSKEVEEVAQGVIRYLNDNLRGEIKCTLNV